MEGPSTKETQIINANDAGSHNMSEFTHAAPPPPYNQPYSYPTQPVQQPAYYPNQQLAQQTVIAPGVIVTQQPGMTVTQPGPRGPVTTTVVGNTIVQTTIIDPTIGSLPSLVRCRSCSQQMVTRVDHQPTMKTHLVALLLCLIGCWPCVCVPYCVGSCQTVNHYCTNCGAYIGSY